MSTGFSADSFGATLLARALAGTPAGESPLTFSAELPARKAHTVPWPEWANPDVVDFFVESGITRPWSHQVLGAEHAHRGRHVVISTGTASGKSLAYRLPILSTLVAEPRARALYLAPTKALGADQLEAALAATAELKRRTGVDIDPCDYDGDTSLEVRHWARGNSRWIFTNPDMMHLSILANHVRWSHLLRNLRYVVIDECHSYRGIFGSHVALVIRRLRRLAARYGSDPVFVLASATTSDPGASASRLIGLPCAEVTEDGSPCGTRTVALWEPPLLEITGENGAPVRRAAGTEAARIMADLVVEGARTLTFVRSRRGAETAALTARRLLVDVDPALAQRIAAYRAGYLAQDRRELERALGEGELLGVATTNALELGIDIAGLDAVVVAGFPGTVASFWQQAGRAGRRGQGSLVILVGRDDPLDTYLVHHPDALLGRPVETTVTDPTNPYVLGPHMLCAAMELPLTSSEVQTFGAREVLERLASDGLIRYRPSSDGGGSWYPTPDSAAAAAVNIRGGIGTEIAIVDGESGRLLGTVDPGRAPATTHPGAVHIHRGESFVVDSLDFEQSLALVHPEEPEWNTSAREVTEIVIEHVHQVRDHGDVHVALVQVEVSHQVVSYLRRLPSGEVLDSVDLDMPVQRLNTRAVMYTVTAELLQRSGIEPSRIPGSLHAAEHAAIGLLPLLATCDRWDIGGVSTALHVDTGLPTVFVYDGYDGGAGFADRGYAVIEAWLTATRDAIAACECSAGCPSCVHSPKCGNGNDPLDKAGAVAVLTAVLARIEP